VNATVRRGIATFSLIAVATVLVAAPANAADPPTGVGSTGGTTHAVTIDLGALLGATVVGENNGTSTDTSIAAPNAFQRIVGLSSHSTTVPGLDLTVGETQTQTTGAQDQKSSPTIDLATATAVVPGVLSGTVDPAALSSIVDAAGAVSTLHSTLTDVQALADLLHVDAADVTVNGSTTPTKALATRNADVDSVTALTVGDFLELLGVDIDTLSTTSLINLIEHLGLVDDSTDTDVQAFFAFWDLVETNIGILTGQIADCVAQEPDCADLGSLQSDLGNAQFFEFILLVIADQFRTEGIDAINSAPLLSVSDIAAGAEADARDTVANSAATVTGSIGSITVGSLTPIDQIDLTNAQAAEGTVNAAIDDILAQVSPGLVGVVHLDLFNRSTAVNKVGDYVKSEAAITALGLTITPPDVCDLEFVSDPLPPIDLPFDESALQSPQAQDALKANGIDPAAVTSDVASDLQAQIEVLPEPTSISDVLGSLGSTARCNVEVPKGLQQPLVLGDPFPALTAPAQFEVASIDSTAEFTIPATPVVVVTPTQEELSDGSQHDAAPAVRRPDGRGGARRAPDHRNRAGDN
jgi:hypothetical protein